MSWGVVPYEFPWKFTLDLHNWLVVWGRWCYCCCCCCRLLIWAYRGVVIITAVVVVVVVVKNLGHSVSMLGKITVVLRCWWKRQLLRIVRPPRPVILINWLQVTAKKIEKLQEKKKCQKPCSTKLHVFRPSQVVAVQVNFPRVFFSFDFQMVSTSFRVLWPPRMEIQEASLYAKGSYKKCVKMQRIEFQVFHVPPPPWYVFDKALRCAALFHSIAAVICGRHLDWSYWAIQIELELLNA